MNKILAFLFIFFVFWGNFSQAEEMSAPVPQNVVVIKKAPVHLLVGQIYALNKNYHQKYPTLSVFSEAFCSFNKEMPAFKKYGCTDLFFRHLRANTTWILPALPEDVSGKTIEKVYHQNTILQSAFVVTQTEKHPTISQKAFKKAVCEANVDILKKSCTSGKFWTQSGKDVVITDLLPKTYVFPGRTDKEITLDGKKYELVISNGQNYYHLQE